MASTVKLRQNRKNEIEKDEFIKPDSAFSNENGVGEEKRASFSEKTRIVGRNKQEIVEKSSEEFAAIQEDQVKPLITD